MVIVVVVEVVVEVVGAARVAGEAGNWPLFTNCDMSRMTKGGKDDSNEGWSEHRIEGIDEDNEE